MEEFQSVCLRRSRFWDGWMVASANGEFLSMPGDCLGGFIADCVGYDADSYQSGASQTVQMRLADWQGWLKLMRSKLR